MGIIIQDMTHDLAEAFDIDKQQRGVLIAQVQSESAAEKAGLLPGDIVISVDGKAVETSAQLRNEIGRRRIDESLMLTVLRDGKSKVVKARVGKVVGRQAISDAIHPFLEGATLQLARQGGIEVVDIKQGSTIASSGLRQGDVILSANRRVVSSLADLEKAASLSDRRLVLRIRRGNAAFYLVLQ